MAQKTGIVLLALFLSVGAYSFAQDQASPQDVTMQRGSIPEELLRPRRDEAPRYPIDTVIGPLGQGQATEEAYETARKAATALLAGNMNAPILAGVNRVFLESCMSMLDTITPRYFRLGGGREEPDGAFSFLVRFAGREEGITGELFVRVEERRKNVPPPPAKEETPPPTVEPLAEEGAEATPAQAGSVETETAATEQSSVELTSEEMSSEEAAAEEAAQVAQVPPPQEEPPIRVWIFEDLILEEPRNRETENAESAHRFDFPPYERFF